MVKHYREGTIEESLGFEGVKVKSISERHRHHQKPESLVNCHQSRMSVKSSVGDGGARSKSLFRRIHPVKSPGKKKVTTTDKNSNVQGNCSSSTSESSYTSYSDDEPPPQKRPKKSQPRQPNGFTKNGYKKKSDTKRKRQEKPLKKEEEEEEEEYVVESIVDTKVDKDGTRYFFVKWENYDSTENTWEPTENLDKCRDLIEEFMKMRNNNNNNNVQKKKIIVHYITTDEDDDDDDDDQDESSDEDEEEDESDHDHRDDNHNKSSVKAPAKPINGIVSQNGIKFPDVSAIKVSMISSAQKVVDVPSPGTTPSCSELSDEYYSDDGKSLQNISNFSTYLKIPNNGNIFYIRIIDEGNGQLNWVYVDVNEPEPEKEIFYRCVVTEDLTGKEPKFLFGATTSVDGEKFCLVQFEGHSYVEVIPPEILFLRFPSLRKFFEVQCPHLFPKNTH